MSGSVTRIRLPWSCAASENLRSEWGDKRRYSKYQTAREEISARAHNETVGTNRFPISGAVRLRLAVFPPMSPSAFDADPEKVDMINLPKVVADGLENAGVYEDDWWIKDLRIRERPAEGRGGIVVFVQPMQPPNSERGIQ